MAEGYSYNPDDDESAEIKAPEVLVPKIEPVDRFKNLMSELFRDKKESKADEEEQEDGKEKVRKGRFGRLWSKLFPSVAQKEDVAEAEPAARRGMFVDMVSIDIQPSAEAPSKATAEAPELALPDTEPARMNTVEKTPLQETVLPFKTALNEPETANLEQQITAAEAEPEIAQGTEQMAIERPPADTDSAPTDRQYYGYGGLTPSERHRLNRLEGRESANEKELKKIHNQVNRDSAKPPVKEAIPINYERSQAQPERTVPPVFRTPEVRREAVKHEAVKRESIEQKAELAAEAKWLVTSEAAAQKVEELKKAYIAPVEMQKYIEKAESTDTKEIAHELSHEHKDMDKQSTAIWAALQASASATATANAKALADAQTLSVRQSSQDGGANVQAPLAPKNSMYKTAVVSGMLTAVIIIAIIIVILLVQSK